MGEFNVGDIVTRKSYGGDVYFKITQIIKKSDNHEVYVLMGTDIRLVADAPASDLMKPALNKITNNEEVINKKVNMAIKRIMLQRRGSPSPFRAFVPDKSEEITTFGRSGRVLHIDGDENYLNICISGYKRLNVTCTGKFVPEVQQEQEVMNLLKEYRPDILVLTGHDGMLKGSQNYRSMDSYRNSKYFVEAVKKAREYEKSYDDLIIFAGACQSYYEALMDAGANFASSPSRVLIHAMDPVFICEKIAFSSISKFVSPKEVLENTITGVKGIGGLETRGKYREGSPKSPYS